MERKPLKKRKTMKYKRLFHLISGILLASTIIFLIALFRIDILGANIFYLIGIITVVEALTLFMLNKRFKVAVKIPFLVLALLLTGVYVFGTYNISLAAEFVSKIVSETSTKEEKYALYVLEESDISKITDLNKKNLGVFDNGSDTLDEALKLLNKKVTFKDEKKYDDLSKLFNDGVEKKIDAIFMSSSLEELVKEEYGDLFGKFKNIEDVSVITKEEVKKGDVKVTEEPFLVYVSGIDTYGSIGTVSRSDVNILIAVNPKTNKVLLVNTPRDYYVKLHSKKAMDKLTHAGIYGVEESMNTLADLYATDVDFYLKINFSSLIKIVDKLGGITVDSKYNFSYDGFTFKKGKNVLDGKAALAFSRCRKELPLGDVSRGENQEAVIKAIIDKASNPSIIGKYVDILKTMSNSFVTNMSEEDIYSLAKFQLNKNPKWEIESKNASGSNGYDVTYSGGKTKLYVMIPNENSVTEVKEKLNEILEES